ncbi:hypothetical protein [Thermosulfuriphilus sp.]
MGNPWFEERRDIFERQALAGFVEANLFFNEIEEKATVFEDLKRWLGCEKDKGPLWRLKDVCHSLWRDDLEENPRGVLFDWLVGSIFHEAMKLKEAAYLLERYHPLYEALKKDWGFCLLEEDFHYQAFFKDIIEDKVRHLKRLRSLFERAQKALFALLPDMKANALVLRFLIESSEKLERLWGPDSLLEILVLMFPGHPEMGFILAGESYLEGNWFDEARKAFCSALNLNPQAEGARIGLSLLERRLAEVRANRRYVAF